MSNPHMSAEAGPSRPKSSTPQRKNASKSTPGTPALAQAEEGDNPRTNLTTINPSTAGGGGDAEGDEDGDEERMDIKLIQSFADKIQHLPSSSETDGITSRGKITIPRRGEKDFEPLNETVNLQEMMLQKSREALFGALVGVRGGHSKAISHAIITPSNPYPKVLIIHGHLFDTIGMTNKYPTTPSQQAKGKGKTYSQIELLPEEALYLLERGTLQIWLARDFSEQEMEEGYGEWCEEEYGVKGAVEMSVMEGFATFIGREGLSWERYQAYAYMKRLGYTVHRTRPFIPDHFLSDYLSTSSSPELDMNARYPGMDPFQTWWLSIPRWIAGFFRFIGRKLRNTVGRISSIGLGDRRFRGTLLEGWSGNSYKSIFEHLRIIPQGHANPLPPRPEQQPQLSAALTSTSTSTLISDSKYDALIRNPYLPFFHIWKPSAAFTKRNWDKGSENGLKECPPSYWAGVVESRNTPIPTIQQLDEVFNFLPDEPKGPVKKVGPQYVKPPRPPRPGHPNAHGKKDENDNDKGSTSKFSFAYLLSMIGLSTAPGKEDEKNTTTTPFVNIPALRNGDRAFVVAVNDSGNTGWIRFGRSGFAEFAPV
ncbi:uncharacterized protein I303_100633 [Kwoniella dejecticola CBS 10117]|uniref:tRNA-splicing endonuclease subunit Sen54 N-terminal domain-containing protein n=1 Tax=Kwoniella dejecticola CBS 10117 TaxID=1296121 RepID=A0A1A6AFJ1_9TREE|nr:uncharacterized protein I303_00636 [Kwoniella dejecticola CBS 10117]OBR88819.1 hypothetical protein I303_00636 [Kwoniella dejecticola CBS 10117]